jgi:hypothetical protein
VGAETAGKARNWESLEGAGEWNLGFRLARRSKPLVLLPQIEGGAFRRFHHRVLEGESIATQITGARGVRQVLVSALTGPRSGAIHAKGLDRHGQVRGFRLIGDTVSKSERIQGFYVSPSYCR